MQKDDARKNNMQEDNTQGKDMQGENMQGNGNKGALARELREKLDWYIMAASEEEYDEKAVEYILYLLDSLEPPEEDIMPQTEEAWQRFRVLVGQRQRQASQGKPVNAFASQDISANDIAVFRNKSAYNAASREKLAQSAGADSVRKRKSAVAPHNMGWVVRFALRHKMIAAAILLLLVLALSSAAQTIARKDTGFFQWLKQDETGRQMMTSPERLDDETDTAKYIFYSGDDAPEWAQEWIQIVNMLELPEIYEWQRFETYTMSNRRNVFSYYLNRETENELTFSMELFFRKISYDSGRFDNYIYVDGYEQDGKWMEIYSKIEESGCICYVVYFTEENRQYLIIGQDNLEELKDMAKLYWECIKNNL